MKNESASGCVPSEEYELQAASRSPVLPLQLATWLRLIEALPGVEAAAHRKLLAYSLFGRYLRHSEDAAHRVHERVAVPSGKLAEMEGEGEAHRRKRYRGGDFLERHREVLNGFDWTGWQPGQWPRQIEADGLPRTAVELLKSDLTVPVHEMVDAFDLRTGERVPNPYRGRGTKVREAARQEAHGKAGQRRPYALCDEQGMLIDVMNAVPPKLLERLVRRNAESAAAVAMLVEPTPGTVSRLRYGVRAAMEVRRLQYQPHSFYGPSRQGRTVRIFPTSYPSVASLWRDVRKALLSGCWEGDLKNVHLACAASRWRVPSVLDLLERDGSAWPHLLQVVGGSHPLPDREAKDAVKRAVYSAVYGMSEQGVRWRLGVELSFAASAAFLADPMVQDLFERRDRALSDIESASGARDCFGNWYPVRAGEDVEAECRSALAAVMQAEELRLLLPVVEDAARVAAYERPQYRLVAWQHDGFALKARYGAEAVARRLSAAVQAEADRLGVPTGLEWEAL